MTIKKQLPMPTFFKNWEYWYVQESRKNDPVYQLGDGIDDLGHTIMSLSKSKDSLQHMVDSLMIKK